MNSYTEGMIVRVFCENFRTYSSIECFPSPKLNMIIGPNGSGKSSLVYAIVLGLGGKTSVIGKEKQKLCEYVRRGCKTAKTEIELYSEPSNYVIGRTFSVDNKSMWTLNGESAQFKDVEKVIKKLNIQVDNLCQFLPQEKVQDFAKMDSKQLLENTLKTVGSKDVVVLHETLKDLRQKELDLESQAIIKKGMLESEKKKIARLETEVKAIKERNEILNKVTTLEKKKAWLEFDEVDQKRKELLQEKVEQIKLNKEAEKELIPHRKAIENIMNDIKITEKSSNKELAVCHEFTSKLRQQLADVTSTDDKMHNVKRELERTIDAERKKEQLIQTLQAEIQTMEMLQDPEQEAQLNKSIPLLLKQLNDEDIQARSIQSKTIELKETIAKAQSHKQVSESDLSRELSAADNRKELLKKRYKEVHQAYEWLKTNKDQFQGRIYGPIMLELNCNDNIGKYVEFTIPHKDLVSFVCEIKSDMNNLLRLLRDKRRLQINVVLAPANYSTPVRTIYKPPRPIRQISQFGFWGYLLDHIEGPDSVLNYLCKFYGLHRIPVGDKRTSVMIDQIAAQFTFFFSDTQNFNIRASKFSREKSSRVLPVNKSVLLAGSLNTRLIAEYNNNIEREEQKINEMKNHLEEIESHQTQCHIKLNEFRGLKSTMEQKLKTLRTAKSKLQMKKNGLEKLMNQNNIDIEAEKVKAHAEIQRLVKEMCRTQASVTESLRRYQTSLNNIYRENFKQSKLQADLILKQQKSVDANKRLEDCKKLLEDIEERIILASKNSKKAYENALKYTENLSPKEVRFQRKYKDTFAELPGDIESVQREICELTTRAECLAGGRSNVLEEYEKAKKAVRNLETELANPTLRLQELRHEMQVKKEKWIPQVETLILQINMNFSQYFNQMNCAGEVTLEKPEVEDEYSKYGICLMMQFRATDRLQKLSSYTQSGGERAVSTAIYMLSLQELTTVPFRCVDEINQGMDEQNERIFFQLLVNTVERTNSAQCFLLTPKILTKLNYSDKITVQCIHADSDGYGGFNVKNFLRGVQQKKRAALKRKHSESSGCSD